MLKFSRTNLKNSYIHNYLSSASLRTRQQAKTNINNSKKSWTVARTRPKVTKQSKHLKV